MKQYIEVSFLVNSLAADMRDWVATELMELGFEGVVEENNAIRAYIEEDLFSHENFHQLAIWETLEFTPEIHIAPIQNKNWNEEWEKNYFQSIVIGNQVVIRAPFHPEFLEIKFVLTIEPRMSFGTGHHDTTYQMIETELSMDMAGKRVLDMGCGTGVLAILAAKLGAMPVVGIDNDEWAYKNSIDNCRINETPSIELALGDASLLASYDFFDIILANINRNIILNDISTYTSHLKKGGELVLSGFYEIDLPRILPEAQRLGYTLVQKRVRNNWACLHFVLN